MSLLDPNLILELVIALITLVGTILKLKLKKEKDSHK